MCEGGCAPLSRCPAGEWCPAAAAAPLRRRGAPLPRCRLPALGRPARMQAGMGASRAVAVGGRGVGWGSHPPQAPATRHPPRPPPLTRVCVWGRRRVSAAQEDGAARSGSLLPRSLRRVAAQGGGRREPQELGERWRRGPWRAAWGGRGEGLGGGCGGRGPAHRRRAASPRRAAPALSPPGRPPPPPPPPPHPVAGWQDGVGRRQEPGSHGGRHAPRERPRHRSAGRPRRAAPRHPAAPPPRRVRPCVEPHPWL